MITTHPITIKNLDNIEDMMQAFALTHQLYPKMDLATYRANISEMSAMNSFRMVGAFCDNKLVGISGYWVLRMLYCGPYLQVSNFVVDTDMRSHGIGRQILRHLEQIARDLNCQKFVLDSYTENKKSHPLYYSEGFYVRGFHFMKDL
ncbi:MAG: GNAT family N-acetyltransferase [Rickettsiales bacterium]|nr:GNAT family N-acetyltransferase [Rickettsiales bacterium]